MCVAAIAWDTHPDYLLLAIGNRDEFHDRATAPLARWDDGSGIVAGRDLVAGGTWLGVSGEGRFALLTNFRDPANFDKGRMSRGTVVRQLLMGQAPRRLSEMNPFNVFHANVNEARFLTNYPQERSSVFPPGTHGLSNGPLGNPWPKTRALCGALDRWGRQSGSDPLELFQALREEAPKPAGEMPPDGPHPDYAPVFIRNPDYGTRCSTIVAIARSGAGTITERRFDRAGNVTGETGIAFDWPIGRSPVSRS